MIGDSDSRLDLLLVRRQGDGKQATLTSRVLTRDVCVLGLMQVSGCHELTTSSSYTGPIPYPSQSPHRGTKH
jgi:hypothetical protein